MELTADSLFAGEVVCYQHKDGYRFSVDAVLLAHFAHVESGSRVLDLGSGCAIIPLILHFRHRQNIAITCIELQSSLAQLAIRNIRENNATGNIRLIEGDIRNIRTLCAAEVFDSVLCNPPYYRAGSGRISQTSEAASARHQLSGTLSDFVKSAAYAVKNRGTASFVYPAESLMDMIIAGQDCNLVPCRLQIVYSYPGARRAVLALIMFRKNGGRQLEILPPFYIYTKKNGAFSIQMQKMYLP